MPKKLEENLKKEAGKKGLKGDKADAYVFGTMKKVDKFKNAGKKPKK